MSRLGSLIEFDRTHLDWRDSVRGILVTAVIMAVPIAQGDLAAAIPLSVGAVFAAIAEAGHTLGRRWRVMLWTTLWLTVAVGAGSSLSDLPLLAILATAPVAFAGGVAGFWGPRAGVIGLLSIVVFTIYVGLPVPLGDAPTNAALICIGGLTQTLVCVVVSLIALRRRTSTSLWTHLKIAQHLEARPARLADLLASGKPYLAHAIRLTIVLVIATAISESLPIPHQYWLPMSVACMVKPHLNDTVMRVKHRLAGTLAGLAVVGLLVVIMRPVPNGFAVISLLGAALLIGFIWANYATAVAGVTVWVMALFGMVGDPVVETMGLRLAATVAAAALVLIAMWPVAHRWKGALRP